MANIYLNGANWVYYDNTTVSSLDWATGFPTGDGQIVVINQDLSKYSVTTVIGRLEKNSMADFLEKIIKKFLPKISIKKIG